MIKDYINKFARYTFDLVLKAILKIKRNHMYAVYRIGNFEDAGNIAGLSLTDVEVDGFDSSAIVVDEEGKKIDNLTNLSKGTKFYIRVPADKVTEKSQNLTVQVKGHFNSLDGSIYSSGANQKVITVTGKTIDKVSGDSIEIVGVPNTGMSTAQTVYFIGLIVLLCGVGIVYANAKPVQDK